MEGYHHAKQLNPAILRQGSFPCFFPFLIERFFLTNPGIIDDQAQSMKEAIGDVVPGHTVPKSHNQHIYNVGHTWGYIAILKDLLSG